MPTRLSVIFPNLSYSEGILYSNKEHITNYPTDGNEVFAQIEERSFWYIHRNRIILSCLRENYSSLTGSFLEIGAGNGFVSLDIAKKSALEVICLEPDVFGAKNIYNRGIKNVICSKFNTETALPNSIDNIGIFDVLEHIEDDASFLDCIKDTLKPNGHLYITVPAYNWLWSIEDEHDKHFRRYSRYALINLLKSKGFAIKYSSYFFSYLPIPMFLLRTIPSKLNFGKKKSSAIYDKNKDAVYSQEHISKNSSLRNLILKLTNWETFMVKNHISIPFGGSIIVVAKKV